MKKTLLGCTFIICGILMLVCMSLCGGRVYFLNSDAGSAGSLDIFWIIAGISSILIGIFLNLWSFQDD